MDVTVISKDVIKATVTKDVYRTRLSNNDVIMPKVYTASVLFYKNDEKNSDFMPVDLLKQSLAQVLGHFYELCGRLNHMDDGNLEVECTNEGVQFAVAKGNFDMRLLEEKKFGQMSLPDNLIDLSMAEGFLFKVQVTYLTDNSVILATALHHSLADGHGNFTFLKAWADICFSPENIMRVTSFDGGERQLLFSHKVSPKFDHPEYKISSGHLTKEMKEKVAKFFPQLTSRIFHISQQSLNKLKQQVMKNLAPTNKFVSTNDVLAALFWQRVTVARSVSSGTVRFGMACNGRKRFYPALKDSYLGNVNFYIYTELPVNALQTLSLTDVSWKIREAVNKCSSDWLTDCLNWVEMQTDKSSIVASFNPFLTDDFAVTSWASFPIYDINFGYCHPICFRIPVKAFDGLAIFLPTANGGVDVTVGLVNEAIEKLIADKKLNDFCECIG